MRSAVRIFFSGLIYLVFFGLLVSALVGVPSLSLGKYLSMILLKIWSMPLASDSSLSSIPSIGKLIFFSFPVYSFPVVRIFHIPHLLCLDPGLIFESC